MPPALASLTDCIQPQLAAVERLFHEELTSDLTVRQHAGQARQPVPRQDAPALPGAAQRPGLCRRPSR